ncbi:hypothetical protein DXG01_015271 [Tephrocybe rancida]|nr:hypothetical protein DXG01_015271 [Tephrocybe rancida]
MLQKYFGKDKIAQHRPASTREARVLAQNLAANPQNRDILLMRFATAMIIAVSYGHRITADDDPYLKIVDDVSRFAAPTLSPPQGSAVQIMPWREWLHDVLVFPDGLTCVVFTSATLPDWFPGTYYANRPRKSGHLYEHPYAGVRRQLIREFYLDG